MSFAGVSIISDGKLQQPSDVYSGTADGSGYHLLVVEGYSRIKRTPNGTSIDSRPFKLGGYRWVLELYPRGYCRESADFISLHLTLDQEVAQPVRVHFDFSLIDVVEKKAQRCIRATVACDFSSDGSWGIDRFMKRDILELEHLKDDSFTIRCDLVIADPLAPDIEVPSSNMPQHLQKLLRSKVGTDVKFVVGGETFVAHRCVLAARSTVFMAELFGPMKEGTTGDVIPIQDMEASVFKAMLFFIYTDSFPKVLCFIQGRGEAVWLQHLLVAADRYDIRRLKSMCVAQLAKHMDLSSVATVLALAAQHHCAALKEACMEFLNVQSAAAFQGLTKTCEWEQMSTTCPSVLNELIVKLASKV